MTNIDQRTPNNEVKNCDRFSYWERQPPSKIVNQRSLINILPLT